MDADIEKLVEEVIAKARNHAGAQEKTWTATDSVNAWNVDDTSAEKPSAGEGPNWDDYWKYWTGEKFDGKVCACCGVALTSKNRVGAHIRLADEPDNTKDAWIALYCNSCNNWKNRKIRKVRKGSTIVRVKMTKQYKNATPENKEK